MWAVSDRWRSTVRRSHVRLTRFVVQRGGRDVGTLWPSGGTVTVDWDDPVSRRVQLDFANDGTLTPRETGDLLAPWATWGRVEAGIRYADGTEEWCPVATVRITRPEVSDGTVRVEGVDAAEQMQRPAVRPTVIASGLDVADAIPLLLADRVPQATFALPYGVGTCPLLVVPVGADVWAQARALAASFALRLTIDAEGTVRAQPGSIGQNAVVWARWGPGDPWSGSATLDTDDVANHVIVIGTHSSTGQVIGEAEDLDPSSPTFVRGEYGRRTETVTSSMVASAGQARQMAAWLLAKQLAAVETVEWEQPPDGSLDVGDLVTFDRQWAGLDETKVWQVRRVEFDVTGPMRCSARRVRWGERVVEQEAT